MDVAGYLQAAPKAELHRHLEGSIRPGTLLRLARNNGVELPGRDEDNLRRWFTFRDFPHFVEIYATIIRCLRQPEDYELIAYELGSELAAQNVLYAEVTFSASSHERRGVPHDVYFGALTRARERVRSELGVVINWVFDIVRDYPEPEEKLRWADYTVGVAIDGMGNDVVALGLAGHEVGNPPGLYRPFFERALAAGLHSDPHAGETAGPASVWSAIRDLRAERIGHGVRAIEDPELVSYLAERGIPLEVCPTSNLRLGVFQDVAAHPLRRLYEAGVPVTVNTDDPPLFNTSMNYEVHLLATGFGLDLASIDRILLNGVRYSFLPAAEKAALETRFTSQMNALKTAQIADCVL